MRASMRAYVSHRMTTEGIGEEPERVPVTGYCSSANNSRPPSDRQNATPATPHSRIIATVEA